LFLYGTNNSWFNVEPYAAYASAVGGVAVVTLCGVTLATGRIRDGIAAAFTATYFVFLAVLAFIPGARSSIFGGATADQGLMLVRDLTKFMGIILASYFGAQAIESGLARIGGGKKAEPAMPPPPTE